MQRDSGTKHCAQRRVDGTRTAVPAASRINGPRLLACLVDGDTEMFWGTLLLQRHGAHPVVTVDAAEEFDTAYTKAAIPVKK